MHVIWAGSAKVVLPKFSSTDTSSETIVGRDQVGPAVAVDVRHRHRVQGPLPAAKRCWAWKVPSPLPSSTDTSLELVSWR